MWKQVTQWFGDLGTHSVRITRSDNKVRELATVCLPWQQWTETSQYGLMTLAYQRFTVVLLLI
jgi:hypothetical protein